MRPQTDDSLGSQLRSRSQSVVPSDAEQADVRLLEPTLTEAVAEVGSHVGFN